MGVLDEIDEATKYDAYIASQLLRLQFFFGAKLDKDKMKIYVEELRHLKPPQLDAAVKRIKQTWRPSGPNPYPAICDILRAAGESEDDDALLAIAAIKSAIRRHGEYRSVSFCDPALHHTVIAFGGWVDICGKDETWWSVNEGRMRETYQSAKRAGLSGGTYLPGICEASGGWIDLIIMDAKGKLIEQVDKSLGVLPNETKLRLRQLCYGKSGAAQIESGAVVRGGEIESIAQLLSLADRRVV